MVIPFIVFSLIGLSLFYLQNLALFPYIHLRLLSLLVFYISLRPSFSLAFSLALFLGLLQDSYALSPLGLHISGALALVAAGRFCRRRFLINSAGSQILASLGALAVQEAGVRLIMLLVGYRHFLLGTLTGMRGLEILFTALLAPLMFSLLRAVEHGLKRRGWRLAGTAGSH
ncbi:MAG: rod shape-determining protein MreD [Deltaproteobacteria bacterium]|nr:rod shape-determining protein MreD [Deltaproteobacteria bacterium]